MIKSIKSDEILNTPFVSNKFWTISSNDTIQTVGEGIYVDNSHNFYDSASSCEYGFPIEPQNPDGSYKRLVYNVVKNSYYTNDVSKAFGLETLDTDKVIKILQTSLIKISIPNDYFGEKIQRDSVVINDYSNDKNYAILDDTYGNLYVDGTHFINYNEVTSSR